MSDLDLLLEEIELHKDIITSAIYRAKTMGNIEVLEKICEILGQAADEVPICELE